RLRQLPHRLGEVAHPLRVDPADREAGDGEGGENLLLVSAGRFEDDERGTERLQPREEGGNALRGVGEWAGRIVRPHVDVETLLRTRQCRRTVPWGWSWETSRREGRADGFPSLADATSWVGQLFGDGHRQPVRGS